MHDTKQEMFANRLTKVFKHISKWAARQGITCYRFYDHDLPEFPFVLEYYDGIVHGAEYVRKHGMEELQHQQWLAACKHTISRVVGISEEDIFIKVRRRIGQRQEQYGKFETLKQEKIVKENGMSFIINLTDYVDTGLFLDHRTTRMLFKEEAQGKRVLNLFCYTGAFTVYAAQGAADTICSVDLSGTYLHWAKRNMQYNKLYHPDKHTFIQADVLQWLQEDEGKYDLVICDPPTFSNSKKMRENFEIQGQHVALLNSILAKMKPGGLLYFSNNYTNFRLDHDALHATTIKDITGATTPLDFKDKLKRVCYKIWK